MALRSRQGQLRVAHFLRGFLYVLVHPAAFQRGDAGTAQFEDGVIREHLQEGVSSKTMLSGDRSIILAL